MCHKRIATASCVVYYCRIRVNARFCHPELDRKEPSGYLKTLLHKVLSFNVQDCWRKNLVIVCTVRSLFWPGALKVLHNQLSNLDFNVVALQETWLESGIQKFDNFIIFDSGLESKKHEFGCRFYVKAEFLKYVKD
jgi:hypothetical protein